MARTQRGTSVAGTWGDWLAPAAAWDRVREVWQPALMAPEEVGLAEALARVLATHISADFDSPPFDRSAVDGYALRSDDASTAANQTPVRLSYVGDIPMGADAYITVGRGQAAWVATGSMIPPGSDAVTMVERTTRDGDGVVIREPARSGDNIVRRGDDVRKGDQVLRTGQALRPQDVAVLASLGVARVMVRRRPRVAIIAGGDELVTPGEPLTAGQIYDSNAFAMAAQVVCWGGQAVTLPRVPDRADAVRAALESATRDSEIVLLSGGSSVGVKDLTADAIDSIGRPGVVVHGVAMRPARPTIIGVIGASLVIGIPGNPVSAMIASEAFARPALETLLGIQPVRVAGTMGNYTVRGILASAVRSQVGRQDYVRVRMERSPDGDLVHPVPGGSSALSSMVGAHGLLVVPPEQETLQPGDVVDVSLF